MQYEWSEDELKEKMQPEPIKEESDWFGLKPEMVNYFAGSVMRREHPSLKGLSEHLYAKFERDLWDLIDVNTIKMTPIGEVDKNYGLLSGIKGNISGNIFSGLDLGLTLDKPDFLGTGIDVGGGIDRHGQGVTLSKGDTFDLNISRKNLSEKNWEANLNISIDAIMDMLKKL